MKRQARRLMYLLLSFVFLAITMLGFSGPASAGTVVPLSSLTAGNTVSFAGYTWIVLDPATGYLLMDGYYNTSYNFDSYGSQNFQGSSIEGLLDTNSNSFYKSLPSADQALIQDHSWDATGILYGNPCGPSYTVTDYIGLLSYSDWTHYSKSYNTSTGFLDNPSYTFWTITPDSGFTNGVWYVNTSGFLDYYFTTPCLLAVRPALYLNPGICVIIPTITTPVYAGATSVTGTALPGGANVVLSVNGTAQTQVTANYSTGDWTINNLTLTAGETISVSAQLSGTVTISEVVTATVASAPTITGLKSQTVNTGGTAAFSVTATSNDNGTITNYQWQSSTDGGNSFTPISGANGPSYTISDVPYSDNGSQYRCVVTDSVYGQATSGAATLTVNPPSSDASLATVLGQSIIAKGTGTKDYPMQASISVANSVATVGSSDITAAANATATFYGTDATFTTPATGSVSLTVGGSTDVYIKVVAQDGTTLYYEVTIDRAAPSGSFTVSPVGGTYPAPLTVTIGDDNLSVGQSVYYSTTGDPPSVGGAVYAPLTAGSYSFPLSVSATVYAQVKDSTGWGNAAWELAWETYAIRTPAPVITSPVYAGSDVTVSGTAAAGAGILLYDNNTQVGTATASGSGAWTVTGLALAAGDSLTATAQATGQSVSVLSGAVTVSPVPVNTGDRGRPASFIPSVETQAASSVTATSAVLNGDIRSDNNSKITDYGFIWGTNSGALANKLDVGTDNHSGSFAVTLGNLTAGTTYYFEAYATNSHGTADGFVQSFTTTPASPPAAPKQPAFSDVPSSYWAYGQITKLAVMGYVTGCPDGTFRPNSDITRAEFVTVLVKALKLAPKAGPVFADTQGNWAQSYISTAAAYGIVSGYDATHFGPQNPITREQMAVMVVKAAKLAVATGELSFKDAASIDAWASEYVATAVRNGIISGYPDGTFRPLAYATRAEAVTVIAGLLK